MTDAGPAAAADPRLGLLQLVAVKGDSVGARFESGAQPVTIGRKATNDLFLRDATVSREHAVIEPTPEGWRLARRSTTLLRCGGEEVPAEGVLLGDGDEIHLGLAVVRVTIVPPADDGEDDRTVVFRPEDLPPPSVTPPRPSPPRPAPPVKDEIVTPPPPVAVAVPTPERRRASPAETPRERFARFDVFAPIHESPTCPLDRATDAQNGRAITLRRLPSAPLGFWARRRFVRAVNALCGIEHANLLAPIEAGRSGGDVFIVYPAVDGVSAGGVLREGRRNLPIELAAYIVREAARGLSHAERAVRPLHLALGDGEVVCRRDGGVAMLLAPVVPGAAEGDCHRAPEETTGAVDVRAAIFSLGVLLWELLACDPVPPGQQMTLRSIDAVRIQVPPALAAATMCAVEVRPDDRFAHADEFADALADALGRLVPGYGKDAAARWLREHISSREGESW
ncbi:MAG TPA: serine/threonine-protein kinase [Candidatus Binatia bacterium]|nr:serine/threonine-protein kinase [Candidatus Binatia bacterium]